MTRGTAYLITNNNVYYHDEFNGDMYPEGHGDDMLIVARDLTEQNFKEKLNEFNLSHHKYKDFGTYSQPIEKFKPIKFVDNIISLDFDEDYFEWFFSDWIFIKNTSDKIMKITTREKEEYILESNKAARFCFGMIDDDPSKLLNEK